VIESSLGGKIRRARKEKGLNQEQLADLLGWHVSKIVRIETGFTKNPKARDLFVLCGALDLSIESVLVD